MDYEQPRPSAVTVGCGSYLATVYVTATANSFLTHEEVMCQVMGKCPGDWWETDPWWYEPDLWVDEFFGDWGTGVEPTEPVLLCPPAMQGCLQPLSLADSTKIEAVIALIDTTATPAHSWNGINVCLEVRNTLRDLMNVNRVFRGNDSLADIPGLEHAAEASGRIRTLRPGRTEIVDPLIHVDGDALNSETTASLAVLLVHEAMHFLNGGLSHVETTPPYNTEPFNRAGSCVP